MSLSRAALQRIHDVLLAQRDALNANEHQWTPQFSGQVDAALNSLTTELGVMEGREDSLNVVQHLNEPNVAGSGPTDGPVEHEVQRQARTAAGSVNHGQGDANPGKSVKRDESVKRDDSVKRDESVKRGGPSAG